MKKYHFSILRYIHDWATEEFANIGVLVWSVDDKIMFHAVNERTDRYSRFFDDFVSSRYHALAKEINFRLKALDNEINARKNQLFDEKYHSISDVMGEIVQSESITLEWSEIRSGIAEDIEIKCGQLFRRFVYRGEAEEKRLDKWAIKSELSNYVKKLDLSRYLAKDIDMVSRHDHHHTFSYGWVNGKHQLIEPISFDMKEKDFIYNKAYRWKGLLADLVMDNEFSLTPIISKPDNKALYHAYDGARSILESAPGVSELVEFDGLETFVEKLKEKVVSENDESI